MAEKDLFQAAQIRRAVAQKAAISPFVLYPAVLSGLGAVTGALFGFGGLALGAVGLGAVTAVTAFATEFGWRRDEHAKQILMQATRQMEQRRQQVIASIKQELTGLDLPLAAEQVDTFNLKFSTFVAVLSDRFSVTELTYARYLGVAEQVYLSGLDNIRNAMIAQKALGAVNVARLQQRLADLAADAPERLALQSRLDGFNTTSAQISELLLLNEKALTQLDDVTQRLARTKVERGMADSDTESAIAELHRQGLRLAEYASQ